jgi:hypothetical protein
MSSIQEFLSKFKFEKDEEIKPSKHGRRRFWETENMREMDKFLKENPITPEMLEELRKGNSVRADAGRKEHHSS